MTRTEMPNSPVEVNPGVGHNSQQFDEDFQAKVAEGQQVALELYWLRMMALASFDQEIKLKHRRMLWALFTYMNAQHFQAWPDYNTLADDTGYSLESVAKILRDLKRLDYIDYDRQPTPGDGAVRRIYTFSRIKRASLREQIEAHFRALRPTKRTYRGSGKNGPTGGPKNTDLQGVRNAPKTDPQGVRPERTPRGSARNYYKDGTLYTSSTSNEAEQGFGRKEFALPPPPLKLTSEVTTPIIEQAVAMYNQTAGRMKLPAVRSVTDDRHRALAKILGEHGLEGWRDCLVNLECSRRWATGFTGKPLNLDWLVGLAGSHPERNFVNVLEGQYRDKSPAAAGDEDEGDMMARGWETWDE